MPAARSQVLDAKVFRMTLPPTSTDLDDPATRPYFLWWVDATVGDLRRHLASPDPEERAYWLGALLREANSRDVWPFARRPSAPSGHD
jgi:hypothetical protein